MTGKAELVKIISEKTGTAKKQAVEFIDAFVDTVSEKPAAGEKVQLVGFGTFSTRKREARKGRKPGTGEVIDIQASTAPVFKPGKGLKERLNKP
ncbi:MAG: HU family DNA-binding protein [Bacillota bacterium]|nr:HU family DNA-binding protein [Bacillota bacterium]